MIQRNIFSFKTHSARRLNLIKWMAYYPHAMSKRSEYTTQRHYSFNYCYQYTPIRTFKQYLNLTSPRRFNMRDGGC